MAVAARQVEEVEGSPVNAMASACLRATYGLVAEAANFLGTRAHALFLRRSERWLPDLLRDEEAVGRLRGAILVFAPSSGEVVTGLPLIRLLAGNRPDVPILICAATASGLAAAENASLESVRLAADSLRLYRRAVQMLAPKGMVIVQVAHAAGLPINLIAALAADKLPVVVVNGYVPDRDLRASSGWVWRGLAAIYGDITAYCMQTAGDVDRVVSLGADPGRVSVAGNMKFDAALQDVQPEASESLARELGIGVQDAVVVAGSTHPDEERMVLEAFRVVSDGAPGARMIVAPRAMRRAEQVAGLAREMGFAAELRSRMSGRPQIIVLDTMGELKPLYGASWAAFIGGTLVPVGGHNVLEPAVWARPVVFGPHVEHTSGAADMLLRDGGALMVRDGSELGRVLVKLVEDTELRQAMGRRALESVRSMGGAAAVCARVVEELMLGPAERSAPDRAPSAPGALASADVAGADE